MINNNIKMLIRIHKQINQYRNKKELELMFNNWQKKNRSLKKSQQLIMKEREIFLIKIQLEG